MDGVHTGPEAVVPLAVAVDDALASVPPDLVDGAEQVLSGLLASVDDRARSALDRVADRLPAGVVRVPKGRIADLQRCERLAVARHLRPDGRPPGRAALRGVALDRFVLLAVGGSALDEPTAELLSVLDAQGEESLCDQVLAAATDDLGVFDDLVGPVESWRDIPEEWWPRLQTAAAVSLADGRVVCSGRLDAELGGPLVHRAGVVVEVKSSSPSPAHVEEVALYALLVGWRDGVPPALVVRWYPFHGAAVMPVDAGVLESAATRLAGAVEVWVELLAGREPREVPGPWCRWCPDASGCPSSTAPAAQDAGADRVPGQVVDGFDDGEAEWEPPEDGVDT